MEKIILNVLIGLIACGVLGIPAVTNAGLNDFKQVDPVTITALANAITYVSRQELEKEIAAIMQIISQNNLIDAKYSIPCNERFPHPGVQMQLNDQDWCLIQNRVKILPDATQKIVLFQFCEGYNHYYQYRDRIYSPQQIIHQWIKKQCFIVEVASYCYVAGVNTAANLEHDRFPWVEFWALPK